jgi:predicted membrane-bound mannosyltransferase
MKNMTAPAHKQFAPETIAIVAVAILSRPANLAARMTYNDACKHAYHLLVSAQQFLEQREALIAAGKVTD